jgi:hypothetical protein
MPVDQDRRSQDAASASASALALALAPSGASSSLATANATTKPASIRDYDDRDNVAWMYSFAAVMVPFTAFCYGHQRGWTGRAVLRVVNSPVGVYGLLALPFLTLGMEKCIYDTVQAAQGINPNTRPADRGGFPSGGAELPSFSLIAVQNNNARK